MTRSPYTTPLILGACLLLSSGAFAADSAPTYSSDVAPILNQNCASCHRPGEIAPMSLLSYDEVRPWAKSIQRNVESRLMPPWHADTAHTNFANDRSLDQGEIDTIVRWVSAGAPEGDRADLPSVPEIPEDQWLLGEPDLIVELPEVTVPADGPDQFHDLVGKVMLDEDRWVTAVEVMPGSRSVVHHVIAIGVKGFDVDPVQGWLGAWAAGTDPMVFPEGAGRLFPKGSNVIADMHYHPSGTETVDRTRIGLHFGTEQTVEKELANLWIQNDGFEIPAGAENHEVRSSYTIWQDGKIMGLLPHMHYRGKDFTFTAKYPDGTEEVLLNVPRYDFAWQTNYIVKEPIDVPAGTVIETVAHYDNSAGNLANPDPTKDVRFGQESYDEMMIGFLDFIVDEGVRMKPLSEIRRALIPELGTEYPGQVYAVTAGDPEFLAPLYLPREGDGIFYVIFDGNLVKARVSAIEWNGSNFQASVDSPSGAVALEGTLSADGTIEAQLGETPFGGRRWDEGSASSGL